VQNTLKAWPSNTTKKIAAYSASIAIVLILIGTLYNDTSYSAKVTIQNNSKNAIDSVVVSICGKEKRQTSLESGASISISFMLRCESHYQVKVQFSSEKLIEENLGYLTGGFGDYESVISITNIGVLLTEHTATDS
jgi:hypothetical protein